jgi:N-acyl homoserine lactone hydrolase
MPQIITSTIYQNITTTVKLKGENVKVHALCTGMVAVKTAFRAKKGTGAIAKINILLDHQYTEYMPIWVWIIEHPEGIIAIDTGETIKAKDRKSYLRNESAYSRYISQHTSKFIIEQEDELNNQLDKINLKPQDVKLIVLTHLHLDHTDGLRFFPNTEIIVNQFEYDHPYANLPTTYPSWFKPKLVDYKEDRIEVFEKAYSITKTEDLLYVPTPGHTNGHSSIIFKTDDVDIIFAGDTTYYQEQLLKGEIAGVNKDFVQTRETYKKFMDYAALRATVYLPSHDVNSGIRLLNKTLLRI